jgi:hypothetical protein
MNYFEIIIKSFIQLIANVTVGIFTFTVTLTILFGVWELLKAIGRMIVRRLPDSQISEEEQQRVEEALYEKIKNGNNH